MLEIRHLETLAAIRDGGSLQEAAERLHLTQSALSHQLRDLETRLGTPLLNRRTRPARLTTAGLRVLALADEVLPKMRSTERELQRLAAGRTGRLHLAIDCHSCFQWLMPALDEFRGQWPDVALDLSAAFSFAPLPALVRGDLDLVITSDPQPLESVTYLPLFKYELVLAVSEANPLAASRNIMPEQLVDQTLITYPVDRQRLDIFTAFLDPADVEPAGVRRAELTPMIAQLVASNRGVAALPHWTLTEYLDQGWLRVCHLGPQGVWRTLYAAVRAEDSDTSYIREFLTIGRDVCFKTLTHIKSAKS
ncbi:LysR family transcriptional regulator [Bordetella genomosp. 1]|uniref:HTH-type transcriptional regulator MetR n=1 Tax=Bordetella genomosp. 1 TaxID=1395607 RepID=A0A261SGT3_9BORD|nr:LysR family transcriptional regulator [Bordetella genomosp. 1]MDQ8032487.1 LysR substrate-binding domain-containing protein [Bordetella sp.]OZI36365.1 LysR family transcriptional regulator [Bordetella genomosp. 1]OZI57822.1 LysR family transcriptional regulator [Bordetella genomosp. 1]